MKGCFGNMVILNFQISQGSVATWLRCGGNLETQCRAKATVCNKQVLVYLRPACDRQTDRQTELRQWEVPAKACNAVYGDTAGWVGSEPWSQYVEPVHHHLVWWWHPVIKRQVLHVQHTRLCHRKKLTHLTCYYFKMQELISIIFGINYHGKVSGPKICFPTSPK